MVKNIFSVLNENISNYNAMLTLMNQGINIFNSTDDFYINLCYDFFFDTEKDIDSVLKAIKKGKVKAEGKGTSNILLSKYLFERNILKKLD